MLHFPEVRNPKFPLVLVLKKPIAMSDAFLYNEEIRNTKSVLLLCPDSYAAKNVSDSHLITVGKNLDIITQLNK